MEQVVSNWESKQNERSEQIAAINELGTREVSAAGKSVTYSKVSLIGTNERKQLFINGNEPHFRQLSTQHTKFSRPMFGTEWTDMKAAIDQDKTSGINSACQQNNKDQRLWLNWPNDFDITSVNLGETRTTWPQTNLD